MADVFISYSRKDRDFVARLQEALTEREREAWLDTKDIPPTAEWLQEIYAAIEKADAFVFVISPEAAASEVCRLEIAHALKHQKRLIPVVRRPAEEKSVPDPLTQLNWIFFREEDDFNDSLEKFLGAISTDLDHVRAHTRLLTRALEWERHQEDQSLLLRGNDLESAELWLSQSGQKEPKPTDLQGRYIVASRRAAARRQRTTLGAVTFGLVVALVLSLVAFYQSQKARHRGLVAFTRQLASQSRMLLDSQFDLALLLSLEANKVADGLQAGGRDWGSWMQQVVSSPGQEPSGVIEARQSLFAALLHYPHLLTWRQGRPQKPDSLALSPDGRLLAWADKEAIHLLDAATGQPLGPPLTGFPKSKSYERIEVLALSPDGKVLASGTSAGALILWDLEKRQRLGPLPPAYEHAVTILAFSPNGKILASVGGDKTVRLWQVDSHQPLGQPLSRQQQVTSLAFSHDGKTLASGGYDGSITLWQVDSGQPLAPPLQAREPVWDGSLAVTTLAFSPDDRRLASGCHPFGIITIWDVKTRRPLTLPPMGHPDGVVKVAFSPDGRLLASGGHDDSVRLWNLDPYENETKRDEVLVRLTGGKNLELYDPTRRPSRWYEPEGTRDVFATLAFQADSHRLVAASWDATTRLFDLRRQRLAPFIHSGDERPRIDYLIGFSPNGKLLALRMANGISLLDLSHPQRLGHTLASFPRARHIAFSPDGKLLALRRTDGAITLYNGVGFQPVGPPLPGPQGIINYLEFGPGGEILVSYNKAGLLLWDVSRHRTLAQLARPKSEPHFSPDGKFLAVPGDDGVHLWDVAQRRRLGSPLAGTAGIKELAFSPDGSLLALAGRDRAVILWDVARGQPLVRFTVPGPAAQISFSPNSKILVVTVQDGIFWGDVSRRPLGQTLTKVPGASSLAFSPDGNLLALGGKDGAITFCNGASFQPLGPPLPGHKGKVGPIFFSPGGEILVSQGDEDQGTLLWDVSRRQPLEPRSLTAGINTVAFSPDGKTMALGGTDGTTTLVDVASRQVLGPPLVPPLNMVVEESFSSNNKVLAAKHKSGFVLWNVDYPSWRQLARGVANRELTAAEKQQYLGSKP